MNPTRDIIFISSAILPSAANKMKMISHTDHIAKEAVRLLIALNIGIAAISKSRREKPDITAAVPLLLHTGK